MKCHSAIKDRDSKISENAPCSTKNSLGVKSDPVSIITIVETTTTKPSQTLVQGNPCRRVHRTYKLIQNVSLGPTTATYL